MMDRGAWSSQEHDCALIVDWSTGSKAAHNFAAPHACGLLI